MPTDSSAKYNWDNKKRLQKKKDSLNISVFLKKKKKKSNNMGVNDTKISQKMKNKGWLDIEKNITRWGKTPHYN